MRNTFKTLAVTAALALSVGGSMSLTSTAHAAKDTFERSKPHVSVHRQAQINKLALRRCLISKRLMIYREIRRLRFSGYRRARLVRYYQFRPRCWQSVRLTACRGFRKYLFEIRDRYGKRTQTFRTYRGRCFHVRPHLKLKRAS